MPTDRFAKSVAVLVMLDVIIVYTYCLRIKGLYPPSHPWSGITLILLSIGLTQKFRGPVSRSLWLFLIGTVLAAGLWTFAAILRQ
jgi:hypothetical protein